MDIDIVGKNVQTLANEIHKKWIEKNNNNQNIDKLYFDSFENLPSSFREMFLELSNLIIRL